MGEKKLRRITGQLKAAANGTSEDDAREMLLRLSDAIAVGDITDSTGIAIGQNIRMVVNQFNLHPQVVASLLDARSVLGGLDPDTYQLGELLGDKTAGFVGREHVFRAIEDFLAHRPSGYVTIVGDPGIGKSALLAEYLRRTGCIAHFNVRALGIVTARQFLENVCTQLIVDRGLPHPALPEHATRDGAFLARLLREASASLARGERIIIAVDALDEVDLSGQPTGANILYLPPELPPGVYFIMTRRNVNLPFVTREPQCLIDLMKDGDENRTDIETYLAKSTEHLSIQVWIRRNGLRPSDFVTRLAQLSEDNFMYLRYILPEIENGIYADLSIAALPIGLEGYYDEHWRIMGMTAKPLPRVKIRIVYILSEVRQPVSRKLLSEFASDRMLQVDELAVQEVLDEWRQFLHEQTAMATRRYSVYHTSFRDFLHRKDIVQAAGITVEGINGLIANNLWEDLFDEKRAWTMPS